MYTYICIRDVSIELLLLRNNLSLGFIDHFNQRCNTYIYIYIYIYIYVYKYIRKY